MRRCTSVLFVINAMVYLRSVYTSQSRKYGMLIALIISLYYFSQDHPDYTKQSLYTLCLVNNSVALICEHYEWNFEYLCISCIPTPCNDYKRDG